MKEIYQTLTGKEDTISGQEKKTEDESIKC